jgi:hypothetical protein
MLPIGTAAPLEPAVATLEVALPGSGPAGSTVTVEVACPALSPDQLFSGDDQVAPLRCGTETQQVVRVLFVFSPLLVSARAFRIFSPLLVLMCV